MGYGCSWSVLRRESDVPTGNQTSSSGQSHTASDTSGAVVPQSMGEQPGKVKIHASLLTSDCGQASTLFAGILPFGWWFTMRA